MTRTKNRVLTTVTEGSAENNALTRMTRTKNGTLITVTEGSAENNAPTRMTITKNNFVSQLPKEQRPSTHDQDQELHSDESGSREIGLTENL